MSDSLGDKENTSRYTVPALARGLEILSYFTHDKRILSGAQLAKMADLPRASVFRMLQTLEQAGYLDRVGEPGTHPSYRLGVAVLRLGFEFLSSMELAEQGRPVLESLSDACGHSSHIVVRDGRDVVVVAKALGRLATFHAIAVGARLPAHATVLGRVLMGGLSLAEIEQLYANHPMKAFTLQTPTTPQAVKALIDEAAEAGYAVSQGGFESGISTVAAPVFNEDKQICAAVSVTVLSSRIPEDKLPLLITQVRESALTLTWRMQHTPGYRK
ncbi:IclR family transcriptional regulator [Variovorax sp. PCZ-1]|uniref:IclR family transcriptional regulator n=1 Tax=Variovorax sp. PCZ-1 TaxID=2835533 RepID=UPI001BCE2F87|nr:IclR family transcriptional regulator [Variovorax sp. PCZ-1]MBS7808804.1 IclR family transcriptional regulator [Variovorax sp. PCZ-1]